MRRLPLFAPAAFTPSSVPIFKFEPTSNHPEICGASTLPCRHIASSKHISQEELQCRFFSHQPLHLLQGPFCEFNSKTCLGAVPQLFDYADGINPCLCVDADTVFDRDLAFGLFRIAIGLASLLLLQCITVPCLSAISSDIVRRIAKVVMTCLLAFEMHSNAVFTCFYTAFAWHDQFVVALSPCAF